MEEEESLRKNDFSVMESGRTGKSVALIGPARFINHSCIPNVKVFKIYIL